MKRRVFTVLLALALSAGVFAGAMMFGSAVEPEDPDSNIMLFPWVPNGSIIEDPREDFGDNGPFYGTITVQNLENEQVDIYYAATDGLDYDDLSTWNNAPLDAYASITLSADQIGVEAPGGGAVVMGVMFGEPDEPARIAAVQKQASDEEPGDNAETSSDHLTVGGYTGLYPEQVGSTAVLPIAQVNSNWNTIIHVTNFDEEDEAEVEVRFRPSQGFVWTGIVEETIDPGETLSIDLLAATPPLGWVGSVVITADADVAAVAERAKNETNMLIMNASQYGVSEGGPQSAPLIFEDWFSWNTGISIANLMDSQNDVLITYYDLDGVEVGEDELEIPANGMRFVYSPASIPDDDDDNDNGGFVGSALITSDGPIAGAVDEVKYFGDDEDTNHAMSYMVDLRPAEAGESLSMPLVQRGDPDDSSGDTTGIQIFNPTDESVTAAIWYLDQNGTPFVGSPEIIALDAHEGHTSYTIDIPGMTVGFQGSAIIQVLAGDGAVSAVSNNVNYSVEYDGSSSYNLLRTTMAGPLVEGDLVPDLSLIADPDEPNVEATFLLTAQLEDGFGNALLLPGVMIEFEIDAAAAAHAGLHEVGDDTAPGATFSVETDIFGVAQVEATRDDPEAEEDWLEGDGLTATVTATIVGTDVEAEVDITWIEPEETDDEAEGDNGEEL